MKKVVLLFLFLFVFQAAQSQIMTNTETTQSKDFVARLGYGRARSEHFEKAFDRFEISVMNKLSKRFSISAAIGLGNGNKSDINKTSRIIGNWRMRQAEFNVLYHLFRQNDKNEFLVGTGLSYISRDLEYLELTRIVNNEVVERRMAKKTFENWAINLVVEDNYSMSKEWTIGIKGILQIQKTANYIETKVVEVDTFSIGSSTSSHGGDIIPALFLTIGYRF